MMHPCFPCKIPSRIQLSLVEMEVGEDSYQLPRRINGKVLRRDGAHVPMSFCVKCMSVQLAIIDAVHFRESYQ